MAAPKNVLLLIADDLGKQLGCYGCEYIRTPNIDRLAGEGVRFENAFASTASCSGSRSTIYTGMHTHQNGMYGLNSGRHHFMTYDHVETAPALLGRKHGYRTGIIGKVHVGPEAVYPWDVREESFTRDVAWLADRAGAFFDASRVEPGESRRPFMLTIGFHDPHRDKTRAGFGNDEPVDERVRKHTYRPEDVVVPGFLPDTAGVRTELANYAAAISRLDQGVGMVLDNLARSGFRDDTLVIFVSDNGPPFMNSKTTLYEAGTCLPLILRCPGYAPSVNPNLVSFVDILPTILEYTVGIKSNAGTERSGRSFLPMLGATEDLAEWDHVFGSHTFHEVTNYWPTRYIRTRRFKYHRNIAWRLDFPFANDIYGSLTWDDIRNAETSPKTVGKRLLREYFFRPAETLYDLVADPDEVRDLAKDPAYADVLADLRRRLEDWQRLTSDSWLYRDGISVLLNKHHLDAGLGVPDNWDLDVDDVETRRPGVKFYDNLPFGPVQD